MALSHQFHRSLLSLEVPWLAFLRFDKLTPCILSSRTRGLPYSNRLTQQEPRVAHLGREEDQAVSNQPGQQLWSMNVAMLHGVFSSSPSLLPGASAATPTMPVVAVTLVRQEWGAAPHKGVPTGRLSLVSLSIVRIPPISIPSAERANGTAPRHSI